MARLGSLVRLPLQSLRAARKLAASLYISIARNPPLPCSRGHAVLVLLLLGPVCTGLASTLMGGARGTPRVRRGTRRPRWSRRSMLCAGRDRTQQFQRWRQPTQPPLRLRQEHRGPGTGGTPDDSYPAGQRGQERPVQWQWQRSQRGQPRQGQPQQHQ
jgi:hypothetical protein